MPSPEWERARRSSHPEDAAQGELIALLEQPISSFDNRRIVARADALRNLFETMSESYARRLYERLSSPSDPLGDLFRLELSKQLRHDLLDSLRMPAQSFDRGTNGRGLTGVDGVLSLQITPKAEITQQRPPDGRDAGPRRVATIFDPPITQEQSHGGGDSSDRTWLFDLLPPGGHIASLLIAGVLTGPTLKAALEAAAVEAAWNAVITAGETYITTVVGEAAEAAALEFMKGQLGHDVLNLNTIKNHFPLIDLISPGGICSVKILGVLSTVPFEETIANKYFNFMVNPNASTTLKAASLLFNLRRVLKKHWPAGFNPKSIQDVVHYVRANMCLRVPNNHIELVTGEIKRQLNRKIKSGEIRLPAGTNPASYVQGFVRRVKPIGFSTFVFDELLDTLNDLPKSQVGRQLLERAKVLAKRKQRAAKDY